MAQFKTLASELDARLLRMRLALSLFDGVTGASELAGITTVRLAGLPLKPLQKSPDATFVFFQAPAGNQTVEVRSDEDTPYYLDADIDVVLPAAADSWLAFPDSALADPDLPLDDPAQPLAYRQQRAAATLLPSTAYPFPEGATLVRGTVRANNAPLAGASVGRVGADPPYVTGAAGEFVLFVPQVSGTSATIDVQAEHPLHPMQAAAVVMRRGMTTVVDFVMP
jgi:hypothetical protein